jgi:hypothetical protein
MATSLKSLKANSFTPVIVSAGVSSSVKITSVTYPSSATAARITGSETITVTGSGFNSGALVYVDSNTCSTTYVSSTSLTFTSPAKSVGNYHLYVYNTDGSAGVKPNGVSFSDVPIWSTASGALTVASNNASYSANVSATGDGTISYSVTSGSLPTGLSLNSSTGAITGTPTTHGTSNFTITATDSENQTTSRSFSIEVISGIVFSISPAVDGKSTWNLTSDGPLNISTYGTYTITPNNTSVVSVKMWGGGGGAGIQNGTGGGGGYSTGSVSLTSGVSHILVIGRGGGNGATAALGGGGVGDVYRGNGGGYSGIFRNSQTHGNAVLMAGGGGGAGGGEGSYAAGAGGGSSGQAGNAGLGFQPGGGTQSAGGAGTGSSGSVGGGALQGANGLSGGGGGYYGGASGGDNGPYAPGAGGGSGYINATYVTNGTTTTGSGSTPANSSDAGRGTSGNGRSGSAGYGSDGRIIITV